MNWLIRLLLGEWAKIMAALMAWNAGLAVDVFVQINQAKFRVAAQNGGILPPGVRRRLIIDELL